MTISLPDELKEKLKKEENYSGLIAKLVRKHYAEKEGKEEVSAVSPQELEIRKSVKALKRLPREKQKQLLDVMWVIRKGHDDQYRPVTDYHIFMQEKGITDEKGIIEVYARDPELWWDIKHKISEEEEQEHEKRLNTELASNLTLQDVIDTLEQIIEERRNKKLAELREEYDKVSKISGGGEILWQLEKIQAKIDALTTKKIITFQELKTVCPLPDSVIYHKVAPLLRAEGFTIVERT